MFQSENLGSYNPTEEELPKKMEDLEGEGVTGLKSLMWRGRVFLDKKDHRSVEETLFRMHKKFSELEYCNDPELEPVGKEARVLMDEMYSFIN